MPVNAAVPADLLTVRHKKGVSLAEISQHTKIGRHYLEAIEAGAFEKLPGGIYSTSYIRQYAQAIDYDEAELLGYYFQALGIVPESTIPPPPSRRSLAEWLRVLAGLTA